MPTLSGQGQRRRTRKVSAGNMHSISPEQLRAYMAVRVENDENTDGSNLDRLTPGVLVLDCRSFVAYNNGHIAESVNAHCPAILRRRCGGRLPLRTIIPNSCLRASLASNQCLPVILYDDFGPGFKGLSDLTGEESTMAFVAQCLRNEADLKSIFYLEGGFQSFARLFPELVIVASAAAGGAAACPSPCERAPGGPVEILPHLFLGCARDAARKEQLQALGITALLNVTRLCPNLFQEAFQYKCIPVRDAGGEDIAAHFQDSILFIDQVRSQNGKVLVHCQAGVSRSATICIAYLMATRRLRMEEAYKYVKSRRRIVSPNFSFMGQLLTFENQIFANSRVHPSPGSPLLAVDASTPDPSAVTPSRGASQNVFDFVTLPEAPVAPSIGASETEFLSASNSIVDNCHKLTLSPCVT